MIKAIKKNRKLFAAGDKNGSDLLFWVGVDDGDGEDYWIFIDLKPFYKVYDDNDNVNNKNYVKNDNNDDDGHQEKIQCSFHFISLNRRPSQRQLYSITYPGPLYFTHWLHAVM